MFAVGAHQTPLKLRTGNIQEFQGVQSFLHHPDRRGQSLQANIWQMVATNKQLSQAAMEDRIQS